MQEQFRIKEGGAGNVVAFSQMLGLSEKELLRRNEAVESTPFADDFIKPLIVLTNSQYVQQLQELRTAFSKHTTYFDDFNEISNMARGMFEGANPPAFLIVYAKPLMLNKSLIHYYKKPELNMDENGSYRETSSNILKSNGGIISADSDKQETPCVFYHPFAWQYIVESLAFLVQWKAEYEGYSYQEGYGYLETEAVSDTGYLMTFAPFGRLNKRADFEDCKIADLVQYDSAGINLKDIWYFPSYYGDDYMCFFQMRIGSDYTNLDTAPLKYLENLNSDIVFSDVAYDSIVSDSTLNYVPIFLSNQKPPLDIYYIMNYEENGQQKRLVVSAVKSVTSLDIIQRTAKLKTPFFRSTINENFSGVGEPFQNMGTSYIRPWVRANIIPPQMTEDEWWNLFYDCINQQTEAREVGVYADGNGKTCGCVFTTEAKFRIAEWERCEIIYIGQAGATGIYGFAFRTKQRASDYDPITDSSGVTVVNDEAFYLNSEVNYRINHPLYLTFRVKLDINSSWSILPEEVVRNSIKNITNITNAIYTDVPTNILSESGFYHNNQFISFEADSIPISPLLSSAGIDVDNDPLEELISKLKNGFKCELYAPLFTQYGTYFAIGSYPEKLVENWRNK